MMSVKFFQRWRAILGLGAIALALTACSTPPQSQAQADVPAFAVAQSTLTTLKAASGYDAIGSMYQQAMMPTQLAASPLPGNVPDESAFHQSGQASYYAARFQGRRTSSGERYDSHALTAAHRTLPLGSYVRVTDLATSKSVVVKINDRGPFGSHRRIIDLSYAAASALGLQRAGVANVRIEGLSRQEAQAARAEMLASR